MTHMGIEDGHQTAEEYRQQFEAACPETIYLLDQPECICWCDDPDPAGMGAEDAPCSMPYVRKDVAEKQRGDLAYRAGELSAENRTLKSDNDRLLEAPFCWVKPEQHEPPRGQLCLFIVLTSVPAVIAGYIQEAEDDKTLNACDIRDQYGEPVGYEGEDIEFWQPLRLPKAVTHLPEVL